MDLFINSRVKEMQAVLFPIQPIPGGSITTQCLQDRLGFTRKDIESVLPIASSVFKYREVEIQLTDIVAQEPRWPTECKVIQERVRHIDYNPPNPEPYYSPTGREPKPKPVSEELGTVVFNYCPTSVTNYFSRSCIGGTSVLTDSNTLSYFLEQSTEPPEPQIIHNNTDLHFESRFESGNLGKVIKITDTYYQLHLRKDLYTQRHMQWFYFRISNTRSRIMYRLSIVNLCKEDSLYNEGLKPLLYSNKDADMNSVGWRRCGENISYYKNDSSDEEKEKHTLTFNITFPHDQDTVYLAHCYPYTYSDLQEYLVKLSSDPVKTKFTKLRLLCRTLAGNSVHYLTITAPNCTDDSRKKKGIVITARVHPGETPSSWMMKGIIDFLTGESSQARELRERFIFKLVPMLNPDGVIVGNNRCSLSGKDLNRQYRTVMRESYPSVWHTKLMIRRLMEECGIAMYCDLHAHSRKHNIFIYGCENKRTSCYGKLAEQIFPLMLHKNAADKFSFENCKFYIEKGKEGTSRVVVWLMGIQNSYTMEASMGGSKLGSRSGTHFSAQDYEQIGKAFCETLIDFSDDDPIKEKLRNKILLRLIKEGSSADEPTNINLTDYSSDEGDYSESSTEEEKQKNKNFEFIDDQSQFLNVPPPSPEFSKAQNVSNIKKLRSKAMIREAYRIKRKYLNRRAMDLPSTDPGSDMCCDLTDSADELNQNIQLKEISGGVEKEENKKSYRIESLPVLKPQTLPFGEDLTAKSPSKNSSRQRNAPPIRFMRHLSPVIPRSQETQMKLISLKQQIWSTGVLIDGDDNDDEESNYPELALIDHRKNESLLKLCSKKLKALEYTSKLEIRKLKKTNPKKSVKINSEIEDVKKSARKKRTNIKKDKLTTNINSPENMITINHGNTEELNSLKLFGVLKLPKAQPKPKDSRKKFRKSGLVASAAVHVSKLKKQSLSDNFNESSSGDETQIAMKNKINKQKRNLSGRRKLNAFSANILLNNSK
ncbi:cytosolic carboxypeptidase 2 [Chelonus insularis]|uniref:cytosolic carboxypeptidase 2 n=1 Tax=Chelonus insularis TaxID=460826 RepID=UPI0015892F4C|nr:cytosolic carboxypeptidase 2 [Chelonus insularis]